MAVAESSATSVGSDPLVTGGLPVVRKVRVGEAWLPMSAVVLCGVSVVGCERDDGSID